MSVSADYASRRDAIPAVVDALERIEREAKVTPYGLEGVLEMWLQEKRALDAWLERKHISRIGRRRVRAALAGWVRDG